MIGVEEEGRRRGRQDVAVIGSSVVVLLQKSTYGVYESVIPIFAGKIDRHLGKL